MLKVHQYLKIPSKSYLDKSDRHRHENDAFDLLSAVRVADIKAVNVFKIKHKEHATLLAK